MQKALPQPATVPPTPVVVIPGPQGPQTITLTAPRTAREQTTFTLHVPSVRRYYLIWITMLPQFDTGDSSKPFGTQIAEIHAA